MAAASPKRIVRLVHDGLLGRRQQESGRHVGRLVRVGIDFLEILSASREGQGSDHARRQKDVLFHCFAVLGGSEIELQVDTDCPLRRELTAFEALDVRN